MSITCKWFYCCNAIMKACICRVSLTSRKFHALSYPCGNILIKDIHTKCQNDFVITCHATHQYSYIASVYLNCIFM